MRGSAMENHYETLEVAKTATAKEIKKAYYRLAKKYPHGLLVLLG